MAEISIGDIVARLRIDSTEFARGIQAAQQQLQQFAQTKDQVIANMQRLQAQGQNTSQSFQQFNQQINATQQNFQQTNNTLNQVNQTFQTTINVLNEARQGAQNLGDSWRVIFQIASGIGLATSIEGAIRAVRDLIEAFVEFGREVVQTGAKLEQLRVGFNAVFGGQTQGTRAMADTIALAQRLGVEVVSLAEAYRRFEGAARGTALEGDRGRRVFEAVTMASRAMGSSSQETAHAITALEQMISKGTVSMEELRRQLGNAIPGAFQIAARAMGVTTQELEKMVKSGQDAIPFVQALAEQLVREFGPGAEQAAQTATAAFERFGNSITLLKDALAQSGILDFMKQLANEASRFVDTITKAIEASERRAGGQPTPLPTNQAISPEMRERQQQIERLRQQLQEAEAARLAGQGPAGAAGALQFGTLTPQEIEAIRSRMRELETIQRQELERMKKLYEAEGFGPGGPGFFGMEVPSGERPQQRAEDAILKLLQAQREQLRSLEFSAPFMSDLERAEQRLKIITETTKQLNAELAKIAGPLRESMAVPEGPARPYQDLITRLATERGIPPEVALALIGQESGFDPRARSRAGAMGLMQLMPGTAAGLGLTGGTAADRQALTGVYDPERNIKAGLDYLASLLKQFSGDIEKALTAYNAGPGGGGIPQRTGENATFAQDVLRRIPGGVGGSMAGQLQLQQAARAALEAQQPDAENRSRIMATGREYLRAIEEQMREEERLDAERRRQAMDTGRVILQAYDEEARKQEQAGKTLDTLIQRYTQTKESRDADTASTIYHTFAGNEDLRQKAALAYEIISTRDAYNAEVQALEADFNAIKQRTDAIREAERAQENFLQSLEDTNERLRQGPHQQGFPFFTETVDAQLERMNQRQMDRTGQPLFQDEDARNRARQLLVQQRGLEQVNYAAERFMEIGNAVGNAWTNALLGIANHTQTVSEAFRAMGQSILQTLIQVTSQEAWRTLVSVGLKILGSALTSGVGSAVSPSVQAAGVPAGGFETTFGAHATGGVVSRPSFSYLAEREPEAVVNRQQMSELIQFARSSAPSAGGQAVGGNGGISIINVTSTADAERQRLQEQAMGRQVIMNTILGDMARGEGSQINRMLRTANR